MSSSGDRTRWDDDQRYVIHQEGAQWLVRFNGDWIGQFKDRDQAITLASHHRKKRMTNITTNKHPDTGIAYGYVALDKLDPDTIELLLYGSQARNLTYEQAKEEFLRQARAEWEDGDNQLSEFDEDRALDKFGDLYHGDEEIIAGQYDGVKYQTSWLGGAQNLWVFESPFIVKTVECSPCVPGAGDLNNIVEDGGIETYGIPDDWWMGELG